MDLRTLKPFTDGCTGWPPQGQWTYEDYARLPDDGSRYEVIQGKLFVTPAPSPNHQRGSFVLAMAIERFAASRGLGKVFLPPIDVLLAGLANPVQPDVLFVSTPRLSIVKEKLIDGAPDLIAEFLSPSNLLTDRREKFDVYAQAGVKEYWIVDIDAEEVEVYALEKKGYNLSGRFGAKDRARSGLLDGFEVAVAEVCGG